MNSTKNQEKHNKLKKVKKMYFRGLHNLDYMLGYLYD